MALLNLASKFGNLISRGAGALFPKYSSSHVRLTEPEIIDPVIFEQHEVEAKKIIDDVKALIANNTCRNFAIIYLAGKQRRVTDGDLITMEGHWPPTVGDQVKFSKILLAGSRDFSLIGRPMVQPGLVEVTATVVGKTLSKTRTHFKKKKRKQYMRINFMRAFETTLRINEVKIGSNLNSPDC